mmetsp:Transcript_17313/g.40050  ORF Transcript_17313/g.40050 Transcript_17313/m.40050 type:complete len:141 (+) Transcript_17313:242-664(+)
MGGSDEVKGNSFFRVGVSKVVIKSSSSFRFESSVNLLSSSGFFKVKDHNSDGNIRGRNTDSGSSKLSSKLWKSNSDSLTSTSFGDNHVKRSSTSATVSLVVVIDQVLVIGERVDGLDVAGNNSELLVENGKSRNDSVSGA